jgi:hypothetical protein
MEQRESTPRRGPFSSTSRTVRCRTRWLKRLTANDSLCSAYSCSASVVSVLPPRTKTSIGRSIAIVSPRSNKTTFSGHPQHAAPHQSAEGLLAGLPVDSPQSLRLRQCDAEARHLRVLGLYLVHEPPNRTGRCLDRRSDVGLHACHRHDSLASTSCVTAVTRVDGLSNDALVRSGADLERCALRVSACRPDIRHGQHRDADGSEQARCSRPEQSPCNDTASRYTHD